MKVRPRKVNRKDKIKYLDSLYTAVSTFKSREEIKNFLKDLLTESERIMIGRRILIAQMLLEDKTYDQIIQELHVGADTIIRVHRWLEDESDGYEKAVAGLKKELNSTKQRIEKSALEPYSFTWLRKKYPLHFFIFNLLNKSKKD